jgi:glucose-6-phosphate 1-dehydrogenase
VTPGGVERLVLLGAAGDLATRHTLPALATLLAAGELPPALQIVGVGREPLTDATYRAVASAQLVERAAHVDAPARSALLQRLSYVQTDLEAEPDLRPALGSAPVVAYLALPPAAYAPAVRALHASGVARSSRLVVEKPFGQDVQSARALSRLVHSVFDETDVFRVDHFLYHQVVQDLLALRLASPLFEPVWDARHVERVDITWEETADVSGRAEFYDRTGALRDMVQSHLLQLLALVAMDLPTAIAARPLRDAKVAVLRSVRGLSADEVAVGTFRGRYTAGSVDGRPRTGYVDTAGVDPSRGTETYAALRLTVDAPRWRGVPFTLRTGKALRRARRQIDVHFRAARPNLSRSGSVLSLQMAPDQVALDLHAAGPAGLPAVVPLRLSAERPRQPLPASARLLRDVLAGDPTFAVRDDETEECWRILDAVLAGWRTGTPALQDYPAGSDGPATACDHGRPASS